MQFAITAALLTLFGALFLLILVRVSQLCWHGIKRFILKKGTDVNLEFNTDEADEEDEYENENNDFESPETHELDLTDGHTDAVEMHRLERPGRGKSSSAADVDDDEEDDDDSSDDGDNQTDHANQV